MTALTRWNPFKQLARIDPLTDFEDLFRGFGLRNLQRDVEAPLEMRMDVSDEDKSYLVKVDMPGVSKENIDVSIDGNQISIRAEIKKETKKEEGTSIHTERYCGSAYRSFALPQEVDAEKAQATYDKGVLSLTLPKKPNGHSQKVKVS